MSRILFAQSFDLNVSSNRPFAVWRKFVNVKYAANEVNTRYEAV
jgi:hypothetical protein